jgi:hypothetical protein
MKRTPTMVNDEVDAVERAPRHECPARAVPQTAKQHRNHQVEIPTREPMAVAAETNVRVITEEAREGHVPTTPEVDHARRLVRGIKVERQVNTEHP